MNRLALTLSLLLILNFSLKAQDNHAPNANASNPDASAVLATVTNYIEGYYTGDAKRMEQTLHPRYLKHVIHGDIPMREKTGAQMVTEVQNNGPANLPVAQKTEQVTVLDVAGDIASAKLVTPGWTDYMTLSKVNNEWKILSVVQRIE
ncbi:MAG TPA: nuclear transport factor 2 family protein [Silvibacterium sp.]|nr:nuclear transport factor 2 family protein [Silvibacterium sp.]